jgi:Flp pilus assembly protein TadG
VEFSLILMPLCFLLLGIIQFGFIFNTNVTMTNAVRDAARLGSSYIVALDPVCSEDQHDMARNEAIRASLISSMNQLSATAPRFTTTAPTGTNCTDLSGGWTKSGNTYTNGDVVITYVLPSGMTDSLGRSGQLVKVEAVYHQDLIVPLISTFLPKDTGGRLRLSGVVTMVIG